MNKKQTWKSIVFSDLGILILLAIVRSLTLFLTNGQSGWHRDELDTLENALYLDFGYVAYPPIAPFIARIALTFFGPSLIGVRLFSTLAISAAMLLTGLLAGELGGKRFAKLAAAVAVAIAPYPMLAGMIFHYTSFDYFWWVLIFYQLARLINSGNPRWWLGIGVVIGLGMMTKYLMAYLVISIVLGVLLTPIRRYLKSPWLWAGVALSLLIFLPNLIWQFQHDFVSLDFMRSIHTRDVRWGRAQGFLVEQFIYVTNPVSIPIWITGLYFFIFSKAGGNYRIFGWIYLTTFMLFFISQGRSYYLAPAYPVLFAGGAVTLEGWLSTLTMQRNRLIQTIFWSLLVIAGIIFMPLALPIVPVGSDLWGIVSDINGELKEQIGWPELVEKVADIYHSLPDDDKLNAGILAGNYGEAGAINLYGPRYGLPVAISGVNSYWLRGYGDPPPQVLIVLGIEYGKAAGLFHSCEYAGAITNRYGVVNEETRDHPHILLCREPLLPWPELWQRLQDFG